jgi:hypothetical protein
MDLYSSNILWAYIEGKIQVKIIDWDGAMFVDENLPQSMLDRFQASPDEYFLDFSTKASPRNDAWHLFILSELSEAQRRRLQGATAIDAPKVTKAYISIVTETVQQMGQHHNYQFAAWYKGFESRGSAAATAATGGGRGSAAAPVSSPGA